MGLGEYKLLENRTEIVYKLTTLFNFKITGVSVSKPGCDDGERRIIYKPRTTIDAISPFVCIQSVIIRNCCPRIFEVLQIVSQFRGRFKKSVYVYLWVSVLEHLPKYFRTASEFLSCLSTKILPIFEGYFPNITFSLYSKHNVTLPLIDSILSLPPIRSSSNIRFRLRREFNLNTQHSLKIDAIASWLNRPYAPVKYCRTLTIGPLYTEMLHIKWLIGTLKSVSRNNNREFAITRIHCVSN